MCTLTTREAHMSTLTPDTLRSGLRVLYDSAGLRSGNTAAGAGASMGSGCRVHTGAAAAMKALYRAWGRLRVRVGSGARGV